MSIKVLCAACGSSLSAPAKMAGKSAKCPKCAAPVAIPLAESADELRLADDSGVSPAPGPAKPPKAKSDRPKSPPAKSAKAGSKSKPAGSAKIDLSDLGPSDDLLSGDFAAPSQQQPLAPLAQRPQKPAAASGGSRNWLLIGGGGAAVVLCLAVVVAIAMWASSGDEPPLPDNKTVASSSIPAAEAEPAPAASPDAAAPAPVADAPPQTDTPPEQEAKPTPSATAPPPGPPQPASAEEAPPPPASEPPRADNPAPPQPAAAGTGGQNPNVANDIMKAAKAFGALGARREQPKAKTPDVANRIGSGIVRITITDASGQELGHGTGFIIDASALVATNHHVVKPAHDAFVQFSDGARFDVVGYRAVDPKTDLAILEIKSHPKKMNVLKLASAPTPPQGANVIAVEHPNGHKFATAAGVIQGTPATAELPAAATQAPSARADQVWIQTDAPISGGSSGGPLLNEAAEVIGINTWVDPARRVGFAIPVRHLIELEEHVSATATPLAELNAQDDTSASVQKLDARFARLQ